MATEESIDLPIFKLFKVGALIVLLIISAVIVVNAWKPIPAGTRGIVLEWGKIKGMRTNAGFITPFTQSMVLMDISVQKAEATESTASEDLQEVTTTIAVNFQLDENYVDEIYQRLRKDYVSRVIKPNIEESIKATTAQFIASELITKREDVKTTFLNVLRGRLDDYHINVLSVSITDFQFSPQFTAAIEAKVTQEQRALEAKNLLEQIRYEAQQKVIQAEAEANATVTKANAEAQKKMIEAEGEATALFTVKQAESEAIKLITEQITKDYIDYQSINQWDGKLPIVTSSNALPILPIDLNSTVTESP